MNSNINQKNIALGRVRSVIRDAYEYGLARAKVVGRENVYDFSLGNPSIKTPECIDQTIKELVSGDTVSVHGYTSAAGDATLREAVANNINERFLAKTTADNIYITCGAAASLTITLGALCCEDDEVIAFAPYFPEYKVFCEGAGAKFVAVDADTVSFQINFDDFCKKIGPNTKAVIINSPNNPSGAVLTEDTIVRLCEICRQKSTEYCHPIYIIADEPYRELVYESDAFVPYIMNYYDNCVVCYSFSKSLSLPGERIGYIAVCPRCEFASDVFAGVCGAGRALGYVCAPSLLQKTIAKNLGAVCDIDAYRKNRDLLYEALCEYGYECVHPDGAFYLFVKAPNGDAIEFCKKAQALDILVVPSDSFGCTGYVRIAYCVDYDMIKRALPYFKQLIEK